MGKYLSNIPLQEGIEKYCKFLDINKVRDTEYIDVEKSLNRMSSEAIYANLSAPFYNCSAMDGIAVKAESTFLANEQNMITLEESKDYIVVDTGDPIPKEFDAVIMVEDLLEKEDNSVKIIKPAIPWQHIRCLGEDVVEKEMIIPSFHTIRPQDIGSMISGKIDKIQVFKEFKVGIIPTGTELIDRHETPKIGDIIEFNSRLFEGLILEYEAVPIIYPIVEDNYEKIKTSVLRALEECDMVLINAGSSQGREDFTYDIIEELGEVCIHGLAIKPGKPAILGKINNKAVVGIPGYPVSAWVVMENIVKPVIRKSIYKEVKEKEKIEATLSKRVMSTLKYEEFVRVKLGLINNKYVATPIKRGAGTITTLVNADGVIRISQNVEGINEGEKVDIELLKDISEINNTIISIGSHDIVMDIINDELIKESFGKVHLSSTHVGSFQGLLSIIKGESHIAPIHLFDVESETYNIPFINKYLEEDVALIKLVKRTQGIIVKKGNPLNIKSVNDLINVRYINRQKGSGTRILFDYLLKKNNINKDDINGYEREEFTHMSLAKAIENGDADCGLGVYSAAHIFDLDFIPICEEEYDLLLKKDMLNSKYINSLLSTINKESFINKVKSLGGYNLENMGEVVYIK
ncbi:MULTISPECIES: molybdopterin biosynthesis protein [Terrisporobacter]|uniref:Molybdopterin molybdenumtransferase n=1 Tax=Terrisporobacter othiniensis TaxID=1577792 RepID=A0A0B3VHY7_9FIRM|nr:MULTISPECIES: molybdopterin biosynthesis protein [Terrisporobacter]KHS56426.1 LysR family transcriptional regulator [Terrisporobacter othiniensis]MCC3670459.1 molybdopterin biosynthesis protein [Terrisporobacter mayombei]MDU6984817.1 molybdopterin biosynthesis protein [Terrisporobacter othiniensis]